MKPLIIVPHNKGDKMEIRVDILEQYINQAYASGYADGLAAGKPTIPPYAPQTPPTAPTITWDWSKVTCSDKLNVNTSVDTNAGVLHNTTNWVSSNTK